MGFMDMVKGGDSLDSDFDELQTGMAEAVDENIAIEELSASITGMEPVKGSAQPEQAPAVKPESPETARRLTAHAQSRLAALESFDKLYRDAQEHLQQIETKLSEVTTSQVLTRRFFSILHTDIYRANELELTNVSLVAEQKRLSEQLGEAGRKQQERESAMENLRQRETGLAQDNETLRAALAAARLELVEAASSSARNEAKLGEAIKTLSAQTVEAERRTRENEVLREKQVSLSIDLDKSLKREAEAQRKLDEMAAIHANEAAQHTEMLGALGKSEKEVVRLQMALESAQMKQAEMAEAALIVEADREAEAARASAEVRGLRSEVQALQSLLEVATNERSEAVSEIAKLKVQWSDAVTEKQVADEKLSALMREHEKDKLDLSAASANFSQLALQQETEQIQLAIHLQECEDLRAEIAALNARIKDLLPFERLYKVTKARQHNGGEAVPDIVGVATPKARASGRRSTAPARGRAV